jgi:hypothetical protein
VHKYCVLPVVVEVLDKQREPGAAQ